MDPRHRRIALGVGLLLVLVSPALLYHTCEDGATPGDAGEQRIHGAGGGFEVRGFTGFSVTYSTDGVRTCTAGMGPVYLPVGVGLVVVALVR